MSISGSNLISSGDPKFLRSRVLREMQSENLWARSSRSVQFLQSNCSCRWIAPFMPNWIGLNSFVSSDMSLKSADDCCVGLVAQLQSWQDFRELLPLSESKAFPVRLSAHLLVELTRALR
jgi:hypothetical protein